MTSITVRNVDPALKERLRIRAAHNGRSMESELRHILSVTLANGGPRDTDLAEAIRCRFAPFGGVELDALPNQQIGEPPNFD
jgi:plasmid stability protein